MLFFTTNNKKSILKMNFIPLTPPEQHKALINIFSGHLISAVALLWYYHFLGEAFLPKFTEQLR